MQMKTRIFALTALALMAATASAGPGQVLVVFKIESQSYIEGIGQGKTAAVEAKIAPLVAARLQEKFPPLEWLTTAPPGGPAATVTVSLVEGKGIFPDISLHWEAKVGAEALTLDGFEGWTVYDIDDNERNFRKPDKLASDIDTKLGAWLATQPGRKAVHDDIVTLVPLDNRLDLDQAKHLVIVALPWKKAKLGEESKFRIEYLRGNPGDDMKVFLGKVGEARSGALAGNTRTVVASCEADGQDEPAATVWSNCVAVLTGQNAPPFVLRFQVYELGNNLPGVAAGGSGTATHP